MPPPPPSYPPLGQAPPAGESPSFEFTEGGWFNLNFVVLTNIIALAISLVILAIDLTMMIGGIVIIGLGADAESVPRVVGGLLLLLISLPFYFFWVPFTQLNPLMCYMAKADKNVLFDKTRSYVIQATFFPRFQKGLQSALDDADDIGILTFEEDAVSFVGGASKFRIPYSSIHRMESKFNVFPGLLLSGRRLDLFVMSPGSSGKVQLEHRESWTIIGQFLRSLKLIREFRTRLPHVPYVPKFI